MRSLEIRTTIRSRANERTQLCPGQLDAGFDVLNSCPCERNVRFRLLHARDILESARRSLLGQVENGVLLLQAAFGYIEQSKLRVEAEVGACPCNSERASAS